VTNAIAQETVYDFVQVIAGNLRRKREQQQQQQQQQRASNKPVEVERKSQKSVCLA